MNWKIIIDEKTLEIYEDEATDESCWEFYNSCPEHKGYGCVSSTRDKCIKKIIKMFKNELQENEKEFKIARKNFNKLLEMVGDDNE